MTPLESFAEQNSADWGLFKNNGDPVSISADRFIFEQEKETYFAEGNVLISQDEQTLRANKAEYSPKSGIVKARGDVCLNTSDDVLEYSDGTFNINDRTGEMIDGSLFLSDNHIYIIGGVINKGEGEKYSIKDFRLSTCGGDNPAWSITGSKIDVEIEGYGTLKNAAFRVHDFPVFYLPYMIFPVKTKRQSGVLLPQVDFSGMNGAGIEVPVFWAISDQSDATFYEKYMSKRGLMQGVEFRYLAGQDSKGEFLFDVLRDKKGEKDLTDPDQAKISPYQRSNQGRYWLRGRLDQDLSNDLTARLDMDIVSDQDYLREFEGELTGFESRPDLAEDFGRPVEERYSSFRRSALRISHDGEDYSLQGSGYYYQLSDNQKDDSTAQPLAGIFYSLLPSKISRLPLFFNMDTDYNYIWRDTGVKGHSLSVNPEISYPAHLGDYLDLNTSAGFTGNLESYDVAFGKKDSMVKDAYQATATLSSIVERIFAFDLGDVTKLKHKITPSLTYEYRTIPEDQESPWFDPIDSGSKINRVGLSIENLLDASLKNEKGEVSYRQWAQFTITQTYDLKETDKEVWEPLLATIILRPSDAVNLRGSAEWDHYKGKVSTAVLSADISTPRAGDKTDRYYIDYIKDNKNNDSVKLRAETNLTDGFSAGALLHRDLDLKYNIQNSLWLKYQAQCWSATFGMEKERSDSRIILKFGLAGF